MKVTKHDKLVRDGIPVYLSKRGIETSFRVATESEKRPRAMEKLAEKVIEFGKSGEPEELADILEIIQAIAKLDNVSFNGLVTKVLPPATREAIEQVGSDTLEELRQKKLAERGGFDLWLILLETREGDTK